MRWDENRKMKFISLFSGCGGFDLGLEKAGSGARVQQLNAGSPLSGDTETARAVRKKND